MKKLMIVLLCLALVAAMFCGCSKNKDAKKELDVKDPGKIDIVNADYININGLDSAEVSDEQIAEVMGRQPDLTPVLEDGTQMQVFNDVIWLTVLFKQVQYSRMEDHLLVTYCYTLDGDETMEGALESMNQILTKEYGAGSVSNGTPPMYSWSSAETGNVIRLYQLNETEFRLQYTFPNAE